MDEKQNHAARLAKVVDRLAKTDRKKGYGSIVDLDGQNSVFYQPNDNFQSSQEFLKDARVFRL